MLKHRAHKDLILWVILLTLLKGVRLGHGEKRTPVLALGEGESRDGRGKAGEGNEALLQASVPHHNRAVTSTSSKGSLSGVEGNGIDGVNSVVDPVGRRKREGAKREGAKREGCVSG